MTSVIDYPLVRPMWSDVGEEPVRKSSWADRLIRCLILCLALLISLVCLSVPQDLSAAAAPIPGEGSAGILYSVTHLHPAVYLVLFIILVLSVVNLVVQGWIRLPGLSLGRLGHLLGRRESIRPDGSDLPPGRRVRTRNVFEAKKKKGLTGLSARDQMREGIVGVRRRPTVPMEEADSAVPTPLDGVNHPMPTFRSSGAEPGAPRMVEPKREKKPAATEFKFASAVDLPSQEELERREKEHLVVSGSITGPDGEGIGSVTVFLSDGEGNRIGQSCRTMPETGEFKVIAHEPGRYFLKAYKRGFICDGTDTMKLPIEAGRIEGYHVAMMPEGCAVQGRVLVEDDLLPVSGLEVACVCREGAVERSTRTDAAGAFRVPGVPVNSACHLEVRDPAGRVLSRSASFETVQKKEFSYDVTIAGQGGQRRIGAGDAVAAESRESLHEHNDADPTGTPSVAP
jgi:hypothetical protein